MTVGGRCETLGEGDCFYAASEVVHGVRACEDGTLIECSRPRGRSFFRRREVCRARRGVEPDRVGQLGLLLGVGIVVAVHDRLVERRSNAFLDQTVHPAGRVGTSSC